MYNIWENRQCGSDVNGWFGQPLHLQREGNNEATSYSCIAEVITDETHHGQQEEKIFSVIEANFWCSQSDAVPSGVSGRVPEQMHTANRTPKYATAKPMKQPSLCQGWLSVPMILNHKPYLDCNTVMRGWGGTNSLQGLSETMLFKASDCFDYLPRSYTDLPGSLKKHSPYWTTNCGLLYLPFCNKIILLVNGETSRLKSIVFHVLSILSKSSRSWIGYKPVSRWGCPQ